MNQDFDQAMKAAVSAHQNGEFSVARRQYQELLGNYPHRTDLKHNLAMVCFAQGDLASGVELIQQAIEAEPSNPQMVGSIKQVASLLMQRNYYEQALAWIRRAIQANPNDEELHRWLRRASVPSHLASQVFDTKAGDTLKRFSPREGHEYIYTIDIVGTCNLRCPSCPVANVVDDKRNKSMMSVDQFARIVDKIALESPSASAQIRLYNWGEPLLHPELPKIIQKIHSEGFTSHLSSNLNIKPKYIEAMVQANPSELKISLSGFNQEQYQKTHTRGQIEEVKENLQRLVRWVDEYSATTYIWVNFHRYQTNAEDEIEMREFCERLELPFHPIDAFYQPLEKLISLAEGDMAVLNEPIVSDLKYSIEGHVRYLKQYQMPEFDCELRFNQMVINSDSSVAQCCALYAADTAVASSFLDHSHEDLEAQKNRANICQRCRNAGLDFSPKKLSDRSV